MKKLIQSFRRDVLGTVGMVVVAALITLPTSSVIVGCANTRSEQAAYKTLYTIGSTANAAADTWIKYFLLESYQTSKKPTTPETTERLQELADQDAQVRKIYADFQASYNTALTAAQLNVTNLSPANVTKLCTDLAFLVVQFTGKQQ